MKLLNFALGVAMLLSFLLMFGLLQLSGYGVFMHWFVDVTPVWMWPVLYSFAGLAGLMIASEYLRRSPLPPANVDGSRSAGQGFEVILCIVLAIIGVALAYHYFSMATNDGLNAWAVAVRSIAGDTATSEGFMGATVALAMRLQPIGVGGLLLVAGALLRLLRLNNRREATAYRMAA
ncbi:MAG: hypothetical protein Alpg2KO_18660 [Alphaproteobacteria bacterium]